MWALWQLHGLGDSPAGFLDIFNSAASPAPPSTKVVLPEAPTRKVTLNFGMPFTSWFDIRSFDINPNNFDQAISVDEIKDSQKIIDALIAAECKLVGSSNVFVGGFSQGCCMALHCGLQYPEPLAGIVGLSGFLFPITQAADQNKETAMYLQHGRQDAVVPCFLAEMSYKNLESSQTKRKGFQLFYAQNIGHEVDMASIARVKAFFESVTK